MSNRSDRMPHAGHPNALPRKILSLSLESRTFRMDASMSESTSSPSVTDRPTSAASKDRFLRHAHLMSGLTMISRVTGLVRDKVCSYFIGNTTPAWSAFWYGFIYPNLFRRIFGEGALTAVF